MAATAKLSRDKGKRFGSAEVPFKDLRG